MTTIKLKENLSKAIEIAKAINSNDQILKCSNSNIEKAAHKLAKQGLSYNTKSGYTKLGSEVIAKHVNKNDIPIYDNVDEILEWELCYEILNVATQFERNLISA